MDIPLREFESLVADVGYAPVPEKFREKIKNVALTVEDDVSDDVREEEELGEDETLLGLYRGIPQTARGDYYGVGATLPDVIILYREPILDEAWYTGKSVRRVVEETIWHEVAHHFGLSEEAVRKREEELGWHERP